MSEYFVTEANFCSDCGALLPNIPLDGPLSCMCCGLEADMTKFEEKEVTYEIVFNKKEDFTDKKGGAFKEDEGNSEPTVDRNCPKCGHDKMSYAALQLRSADEGQTVFFTCLKCKFKETENS